MKNHEKTLVIRGGRVVDPSQGLDRVADLWIADGAVAAIGERPASLAGRDVPVLDAAGKVVCPGFVDLHCHLRDPGQEDKETIQTGAEAAAAGGFTTIVCMANTEPVIDAQATVEYVLKSARTARVRVLPVAAVTMGLKGERLAEMVDLARAGAVGFSDDGRPVADAGLMRRALEYSRLTGRPIMNHCEEPSLSRGGAMHEGWVSTLLGLPGIPAVAEEVMIARDLALAELTSGRLHLLHVSTAGGVQLVREAKARGVNVTAEATPHHLALTDEWVAGELVTRAVEDKMMAGYLRPAYREAYNTHTKVNPPLRTRRDAEALLAGLLDGTIDAIATDHAPHRAVDKVCEYGVAAFGISGLETALGLLLTLVHAGQLDLSRLITALTSGPARVLDRADAGTLRPGAPADVAIFDPNLAWTVDPSQFASLGKNSPLAGVALRGKVTATLVGGEIVYGA